MCLIDTMDGALMLSLYIQPAAHFLPSERHLTASTRPVQLPTTDNTRNQRDPIAFLYYSIVLTSLTVIVALVIGVIQLLTMIDSVVGPEGKFWEGVETAGDYYDAIGAGICGLFLVFSGLSVVLYPYWRKWIGKDGLDHDDLENASGDQSAEAGGIYGSFGATSIGTSTPQYADARDQVHTRLVS